MKSESRKKGAGRILCIISTACVVMFGASGCSDDPLEHVENNPQQWDDSERHDPDDEAPSVETPPEPTEQVSVVLSGGTTAAIGEGCAVVADPDRDMLHLACGLDLENPSITAITLEKGDEPGRSTIDDRGNVYTLLRRAGSVVAVDPNTGTVLARQRVCAAPRGIAFDPLRQQLHISCFGGLLESFRITDDGRLQSTRILQLAADLRDVVVLPSGKILVSTFRTAQVFVIHEDFTHSVLTLPSLAAVEPRPLTYKPSVAWRMIATDQGAAMLHQRAQVDTISNSTAPYYTVGPCGLAVVHSAITLIEERGGVVSIDPRPARTLPAAVLPVDLAYDGQGSFVVIAAGNADTQALRIFEADLTGEDRGCLDGHGVIPSDHSEGIHLTSAAFLPSGELILQSRNPAAIIIDGELKNLPAPSTPRRLNNEEGFHLFNMDAGGYIACASCHPEGGDDAHVWDFPLSRQRRTQALFRGILATAPFHWRGDVSDMDDLMQGVFVKRMGGFATSADLRRALSFYINHLPDQIVELPFQADPAAIERGGRAFTELGCAGCHHGPFLTDNLTHPAPYLTQNPNAPVSLQTPSIRHLRARYPYTLTGCAQTLEARFSTCAQSNDDPHNLNGISPARFNDIISFLEAIDSTEEVRR